MDRSDGQLQFPELQTGPRLDQIEIAGRDAEAWRRRLKEWLRLPGEDGHLIVGYVRISFTNSNDARLQVSPTFVVGGVAARLPLSDGYVSLVTAL